MSTSCFFASSTLKTGGGVFNCLSGAENLKFLTSFGRFFMKNGTFWYIQMLQIVFSSSVCPYNLLLQIQHPQKGWGIFECLSCAEKLNL